MGGGLEGEGGAKDDACRFLASETGWEVVLLPPDGSPGSTRLVCGWELVDVCLMFLKDHIAISVSK